MTGRLRAERAAWRAARRVPAYRTYLSAQGVAVDRLVPAGILQKLPETDKPSYIDPYPLAERCLYGRIRYNVHDEGGIHDYGRMMTTLQSFGLGPASFGRDSAIAGPRGPLPWTHPVRLPFLWIYGRRDATISVMGANIYPEDIETIVYRDRLL